MNAPIRQHRRSGFVLHEAMMAIALAMAILAGLAQLLGMVAQQRRLARQQAIAMTEAGNLMEDLASRRWNEIEPPQLASLGLSEQCQQSLPDGKLHVEVVSEEQDTKRISLWIDWLSASGRRGEPVRLVGWVYRNEEVGP